MGITQQDDTTVDNIEVTRLLTAGADPLRIFHDAGKRFSLHVGPPLAPVITGSRLDGQTKAALLSKFQPKR